MMGTPEGPQSPIAGDGERPIHRENRRAPHGPQLYMRRTAPSSGRTDVHQTSTPRYTTIHHVQCRHRRPPAVYVVPRFGGKFRVKFWGPLFGAQVFSLRLSSPRERLRGTDSHGSHVPAPPGDFLPVPVSQTCSDSETVHGTCCVWEVGTGNWFRSLQLINLSGRWASCW